MQWTPSIDQARAILGSSDALDASLMPEEAPTLSNEDRELLELVKGLASLSTYVLS